MFIKMLISSRTDLIISLSTSFKLNAKINIKKDYRSVSNDNVSILFNKKYLSL